MSRDPIAILDSVNLLYRRPTSRRTGLRQLAIDAIQGNNRYTEFSALSDISFQIEHGETVAIIGHNGSGKSTLLKVLARVLTPSSGRIRVRGKVSPILDLGAGFSPDLSGRENIKLNSAILGRTSKEISETMDSIIDWADLGEVVDLPIRMYSTGMTARLAFSIATAVTPDLLLIDEILSVGDVKFQEKSLERMAGIIASECSTILVSHSPQTIRELATRVICLNSGKVTGVGPVDEVLDLYLEGKI